MSTATLRSTAGSILGAVAESANAVGSLFTAASGGAAMLNTYVSDARTKQGDRSIVEMHSYRSRLIEETAEQNSLRRMRIVDAINGNPQLKKIYEEEFTTLSGLFEKPTDESSN
jgi:hypothetical protein